MLQLAPKFSIETGDFHFAWLKAMQNVLKGTDIIFGSKKDPKRARDSIHEISMTGNAIEQILAGKLHPKFTFKSIAQYRQEFEPEFLKKYDEWPPEKKFTYLYIDRILRYPTIDGVINQLDALRDQIAIQIDERIVSNRCQAITWNPPIDLDSNASPCLQRIWQRPYFDKETDAIWIDLQNDWRSRDLFNAWQPNLIALVCMLDKYVYKPNGCQIGRVIDRINSLHIYQGDVEQAKVIVREYLPPTI